MIRNVLWLVTLAACAPRGSPISLIPLNEPVVVVEAPEIVQARLAQQEVERFLTDPKLTNSEVIRALELSAKLATDLRAYKHQPKKTLLATIRHDVNELKSVTKTTTTTTEGETK